MRRRSSATRPRSHCRSVYRTCTTCLCAVRALGAMWGPSILKWPLNAWSCLVPGTRRAVCFPSRTRCTASRHGGAPVKRPTTTACSATCTHSACAFAACASHLRRGHRSWSSFRACMLRRCTRSNHSHSSRWKAWHLRPSLGGTVCVYSSRISQPCTQAYRI